MNVEPNSIIFRKFGDAEGFVDKKKENLVFKVFGDNEIGAKLYEKDEDENLVWRIEEFLENAVHFSK